MEAGMDLLGELQLKWLRNVDSQNQQMMYLSLKLDQTAFQMISLQCLSRWAMKKETCACELLRVFYLKKIS